MRAPSPSRPRLVRLAVSEALSAALIVAVTLALSGAAYALADFHVSPVPVFTQNSFSIFGTPSFLHIQVNSSSPASLAEFQLDDASSASGFLALTAAGYSVTGSLCAQGAITFFSVSSGSGTISVSGSGVSWIDGVETSSETVESGWHEVVISNGSNCSISLPNGVLVDGPSPGVSTLPVLTSSDRSFTFLVPYYSSGHVATIVFDGGTQVVGF